jgi:hypothetical protein
VNLAYLGPVRLSGSPLELVRPEILRHKAFEPIVIIGRQRLKNLDIRLRVKGGGYVAQIYGELSCRDVPDRVSVKWRGIWELFPCPC